MYKAAAVILSTVVFLCGCTDSAQVTQCRDAKGQFTHCPDTGTVSRKVTHRTEKREVVTSTHPAKRARTAKCNDGSVSHSKTHSGTCSHHGGVASWS
jgi:hypothetical protein